MTIIEIQPVQKELNYFVIPSVTVKLFGGASVSYVITDNKSVSMTGQLEMDSTTYDNWGDNDEYVYNWALQQLGLTKK